MKSVGNANIKQGQKVLVRCDLDVPISVEGNILETFRLDHALPTLKLIIDRGGFPVIMGHLGRPEGTIVGTLSTSNLHPYFGRRLGSNNFELLENLRFDSREKDNDKALAVEIIEKTQAEIYVNESFATCHREHTSMMQFPKLLPSYAGLRLEKEINMLDILYTDAMRPFVSIIGGAKLKSKKPAVNKFLEITDKVLVGGKIGLDWDEEIPEKLYLPPDYAKENKDIGPETIEKFIEVIGTARTIVWSGPMGLFEEPEFMTGTKAIAEAIAKSSAYSVVGGGDTIAALNKLGLLEKMSFVSSGGGAMLEFLVKGTLPALQALEESNLNIKS